MAPNRRRAPAESSHRASVAPQPCRRAGQATAMRSSMGAKVVSSLAVTSTFRERLGKWQDRRPVIATSRSPASVRSIERSGQIFVPRAASLQNAGLRLIVDVVDPKALGVTRGPFKVVEQGPYEVAAHIDTLIDGVRDGAYVRFNIGAPIFILNA